MLNKVILIGNLGDDVKMHHFEGGNCVGTFPLATSETYKNKQGEKVTSTEWHTIKAYNKQAEVLEKYLSKGDKIYLEGSIKTVSWDDPQGNKKYSKEITLKSFQFLNTKSNNNNQDQTDQVEYNESDEEDLPF